MPKFQRYLRLTEARDFQRDKRARSYRGVFLTCVVKTNGLEHSRLGLVVGKKVASKACQRVKIKRVLRESFRHHYQALPQVDIILIAKQGINKLSAASVRKMADEQLRDLQCQKPQCS